jgi:hypothetical protein
VLFTIRTYVTPIPVVLDQAAVARRLAASIESLPADVRAYKDLAATSSALVPYLRVV